MITKFFRLILLMQLVLPIASHAQSEAVSNGLNWLKAGQAADGSWSSAQSSSTAYYTTVSVLDSLTALGETTSTAYTNGLTWTRTALVEGTAYIAPRVRAVAVSGGDATTDLNTLLSYYNAGYGWGGDAGHSTSIFHTALGLQAVKAVSYSDPTVTYSSLAYLTQSQNSDGGWGFRQGDDSNVYMTAVVSATLQQFPQMTTIASATSKATAYLAAHQNTDGGFGLPSTVFETALAYSALVAVSDNAAILGGAVNYLSSTQSANGSWNDDPYSTALALKALHLSENRPSPPPPPPAGGKIAGTVIDAVTKARVDGVAVVLASNPLINTASDSLGNFTLPDVPAGSQSVNLSLSGYAAKTTSTGVAVDSVANIGNVEMISSYSTGTIAGMITDAAGKALPDVVVTVTGAWSGATVTGADGGYSFTYVFPGEVSLTAAKAGYQPVTGAGTVFARTKLTFSPRLGTTPSQVATGTLVGRVVESYFGLPIGHLPEEPGVIITVSGGISVVPDNNGYFTVPELLPNTYQVTVGMNGFASRTFRVVVVAGASMDLGTIRLEMSAGEMTLTGKVTDATTGEPILGAEVAIVGTDFAGRSDFAGTYGIDGIKLGADVTLRASANGYIGRSFLMRPAPWTKTIDISLMPQVTTGSLTGAVVDASSDLPLEGVTVTLLEDPAVSTVTDSAGAFTLKNVKPGSQKVSLTLEGYAPRVLTTAITLGAVSNVGDIQLSVATLAASIQGMVWDAATNTPFADVTMKATGTGSLQSVTAADGRFKIDNVEPGEVTVATGPVSKPGYSSARLTGILEPGGVLVFNPVLAKTIPATVDLTVASSKDLYKVGETVDITLNLQNKQGAATVANLYVQVIDPTGSTVYEKSIAVDLAADGTADLPLSFDLPVTAEKGGYMVVADAYAVNGSMLNRAAVGFGVAVSQVAVTPTLPAVFSTGANAISFNLSNTGTVVVSAGSISVTLKDPDGQVVSTSSLPFGLDPGQSINVAQTLSIPSLKFGNYTLSYAQSDETKTGAVTDLSLPNTYAVTALYDDASHHIRGNANLSVTLSNTGRFNILSSVSTDPAVAVSVTLPDAPYSETKSLSSVQVPGGTSGGGLLYSFVIPETMTAGQHATKITVNLPSGSMLSQTAYLAITESSLSLSPIQPAYAAGDVIRPVFSNSGGVDTQVEYSIRLYDAKSMLIAEKAATDTVATGSTVSPGIAIPAGAVDGSYNLVINYRDSKTGKEGMMHNPVSITGVKGSLQVKTDKQDYLLTESVTGLSTISSSGAPLDGGNLHLQVTAGPGTQKMKSWTTQADFQTGVRSGVDTYGVNDWIVPDDEFSSAVIDSDKWRTSGQVSLNTGKISLNGLQGTAVLISKWELEGDFDIQVDFSNNNSVYDQGVSLSINMNDFLDAAKGNAGVGNASCCGYTSGIQYDGLSTGKSAGSFAASGKLRITRIGSTVATYYGSGSNWIEVNRATSPQLAAPCKVGMSVWRRSGYPTGATAMVDNFKVNSGRIKTENQTVDSVRLLPMNDNFDDGVLNEDRWEKAGANPFVESLGSLRIISDSVSTWNRLQLQSSLSGDFIAVANYKNFAAMPSGTENGELYFSAGIGTSGFYVVRSSDVLSRAGGQFLVGLSHINGAYYMGQENKYPSGSGSLRLRRVGTTGYDEYWDGIRWPTIFSDNRMPLSPAKISFVAASCWDKPTIQFDLDSFYTNKGTYNANGTINLKFDSMMPGNRWGRLLSSSDQPWGTSIKFRTRTADTEAGLANATWSDYLTTSGSPVSSPAARWIEIESTFSTTDANVTPLLNDLTVTYEGNPGEILWQTDVPSNLAQGAVSDLDKTIGTLGMSGKFYLEGTLTSSTGQTVASAEYPFFVEQGNIQIYSVPDKKIYRPGETVTVTGEVKNLSVSATGLTAQIQGAGLLTPYIETFDLPANSAHPFSFTTTAGNDGIYLLTGAVSQNSAILADTTDQYEVASPALTATLTAPDTVGDVPFVVSVMLENIGKVSATTNVHVVDDSGNVVGDQSVALAVGESSVVQFTRQITGVTTYTATMSGDLTQALTKQVTYVAPPLYGGVSAKIVTDKVNYDPNQQVTLTATVTANSANENLSTLITVTNAQGQAVYSATDVIAVLIPGQTISIKKYWNTGINPAGSYLVTLQILNAGGSAISGSACDLVINSTTQPTALLKGQLSLNRQSILTGEPVSVSYGVTNSGNLDLPGIELSLLTVAVNEETVYSSSTDQASLAIGASYNNSIGIDTQGYRAMDYLVLLRGSIAGGEVETLGSAYFRVEGAPSAPALFGPAQGADLETFTPTLSVSNAADPNDNKLSYQFEIYSDSGLTTLADSGTVSETSGSTAWTVLVPLTENQTYFWRTRAFDGLLYGPWMAPASFRVNTVNDLPAPPAISSPVDGTDVAVLNPVLSIGNAADPDSASLTYNFEIALDSAFTEMIASTRGVTSGEGTTSWVVPENLQENTLYYWRAQGDDWLSEGPWSTTARFLVNTSNDAPSAPVVLAPASGSTIDLLATDVTALNGADPDSSVLWYHFEADTEPTFDSTSIIRSGPVPAGEGTTSWHLSGLQDNTRYHIRVKASDGAAESPWSAVSSFFANTVNDPPTTPILANPSNGGGVSVFAPALSVHNSTDLDKDAVSYEFEVYADQAMTELVVRAGGIVETLQVTGWQIPQPLAENGTYYWRSRAFDGTAHSDWSTAASFMVNTANDAPSAPGLFTPAEGAGVATPTPELAVVNATDPDSDGLSYQFEIYAAGSLVISSAGVTENVSGITAWTPGTPLVDDTVYQWRARAFDGDSYGAWTGMASFTVHIPKTSITAMVDFDPDTLNRSSKGTWVVVYIELPDGYKPADIDISSLRLAGSVSAETRPFCIGDYDKDGIPDLMVKFRRSELIDLLSAGDRVTVHVTGEVGQMTFDGVDVIRVIK